MGKWFNSSSCGLFSGTKRGVKQPAFGTWLLLGGPLGKKKRHRSCEVLFLPHSGCQCWALVVPGAGECKEHVKTSAPEEAPRGLLPSASSPTGPPRCWDPTGKRAGKVSGGDLSEEPCKHIKEEQSPDRVGTCQLQRHQIAERVSCVAFLPLAPDGPCARGPGTLETSKV